LKEFNGLSLPMTVDCIRVEGFRAKLKKDLTQRREVFKGKAQRTAEEREEEKKGIWEGIKEERKGEEFSWNIWAMEYGFSSYRKLYRACLVVYRMTPRQIEIELIGEVLSEMDGVETVSRVRVFTDCTLAEIEQVVKD
jgi:hypothetical protein